MDWHPLRFQPIYKERVWGGQQLRDLYRRDLPPGGPYGESWEISDRPGDRSIVADGPMAGRTLHELLALDPAGLLGSTRLPNDRFPLLVKILDARETLSVQVHPPARVASTLGGEPKTEMWYFTAADPGAEILAGLRPGTTRTEFESRLHAGTVADCIHRQAVSAGDAMFLPSGRVHALGAGVVLFEIQQNSDTTYRVFDWNRTGLDGQPRALHVSESLASIDFEDFAPSLLTRTWEGDGVLRSRRLVRHSSFSVDAFRAERAVPWEYPLERGAVLGVVEGSVEIADRAATLRLAPGDFCLLPAALGSVRLATAGPAEWLFAQVGPGEPEQDIQAAAPLSR